MNTLFFLLSIVWNIFLILFLTRRDNQNKKVIEKNIEKNSEDFNKIIGYIAQLYIKSDIVKDNTQHMVSMNAKWRSMRPKELEDHMNILAKEYEGSRRLDEILLKMIQEGLLNWSDEILLRKHYTDYSDKKRLLRICDAILKNEEI